MLAILCSRSSPISFSLNERTLRYAINPFNIESELPHLNVNPFILKQQEIDQKKKACAVNFQRNLLVCFVAQKANDLPVDNLLNFLFHLSILNKQIRQAHDQRVQEVLCSGEGLSVKLCHKKKERRFTHLFKSKSVIKQQFGVSNATGTVVSQDLCAMPF